MKIVLNIEKRYALTIMVLLAIMIALVGIVAYGTNNPQAFGHSLGEIEFKGNLEIENSAAGDVSTGRFSTQSLGAECPNGWGCGVHTWDLYADASIRTKDLHITSGIETPNYAGDDIHGTDRLGQICLNSPHNGGTAACIDSWDDISAPAPTTYTLEAQWFYNACPDGWVSLNLVDCDSGDVPGHHDVNEDSGCAGHSSNVNHLCMRLVAA